MAADLLEPFTGLLDAAGGHIDSIGPMTVLIGLAIYAATMGDDIKDKYMLHYWVRILSPLHSRCSVAAARAVHRATHNTLLRPPAAAHPHCSTPPQLQGMLFLCS